MQLISNRIVIISADSRISTGWQAPCWPRQRDEDADENESSGRWTRKHRRL